MWTILDSVKLKAQHFNTREDKARDRSEDERYYRRICERGRYMVDEDIRARVELDGAFEAEFFCVFLCAL